ncbi:MAG TPA: hypothetical protein VFE79_09555 [Paraburkholderia sp.]|nr:hypothetical protein [Paraburkholderia sp.]
MKKKIAVLAVLLAAGITTAYADSYVQGYSRRDGTYVDGYRRTEPNSTRNDNYSTRGNYNPYTDEEGNRPRDEETQRNGYYQNNGY